MQSCYISLESYKTRTSENYKCMRQQLRASVALLMILLEHIPFGLKHIWIVFVTVLFSFSSLIIINIFN